MVKHHKDESKAESKSSEKKEDSEVKVHKTSSKGKKYFWQYKDFWKYATVVLAVALAIVIILPIVKQSIFKKSSTMIVINDKRCSECDVTQLIGQLKTIFPDIKVKTLDYSDKQGKELYEKLKLTYLPAVLFDKSVEKTSGYAQIQRYLDTKKDYYSLRIGASFNPTKEICDNGIDDTNNGLVDCADPDCTNAFECREEKKNHLTLFIMSDCPYGRKAVEALKEVVDNFGSTLQYEIHYIASEVGDGFQSLHGQYEVDEDIVQLCVHKHSPTKWLEYIYCRSKNGVSGKDWQECAQQSGVDIEKVSACSKGEEGKSLLREDIKIAEELNIGASPTWIANNRYEFGGIDAETVKTQFCKYNSGTAGCEKTLSSSSGTSGTC